jgi:hypothetical protein
MLPRLLEDEETGLPIAMILVAAAVALLALLLT